jgi:hypothetical protein
MGITSRPGRRGFPGHYAVDITAVWWDPGLGLWRWVFRSPARDGDLSARGTARSRESAELAVTRAKSRRETPALRPRRHPRWRPLPRLAEPPHED